MPIDKVVIMVLLMFFFAERKAHPTLTWEQASIAGGWCKLRVAFEHAAGQGLGGAFCSALIR
jgi:hypothetical protein